MVQGRAGEGRWTFTTSAGVGAKVGQLAGMLSATKSSYVRGLLLGALAGAATGAGAGLLESPESGLKLERVISGALYGAMGAASGRAGVTAGGEGATGLAGRRVTQFYDPARGTFGPGSAEALSTGSKTWVTPRAAAEHNWWSRMMSGRGSYRSYVEFDVAASELRSARSIKGIWPYTRYQRVMEPGVSLAGRNAKFEALGPNYGQTVFVWGVLPTVVVGSGYVVYQAAKKK